MIPSNHFKHVNKMLTALSANIRFSNGGIGIERENLRINKSTGEISTKKYNKNWGSPLKNPHITTDFAESMPEFVTGIYTGPNKIDQCYNFLSQCHTFTYQNGYQDETFWPLSMPPKILNTDDIKLAYYGTSNTARIKQVYRKGLILRYGALMQMICGIHFNYSLPKELWPYYYKLLDKSTTLSIKDFKSDMYFSLIRNFQKLSWIIPYLFGSSPAIDLSFKS